LRIVIRVGMFAVEQGAFTIFMEKVHGLGYEILPQGVQLTFVRRLEEDCVPPPTPANLPVAFVLVQRENERPHGGPTDGLRYRKASAYRDVDGLIATPEIGEPALSAVVGGSGADAATRSRSDASFAASFRLLPSGTIPSEDRGIPTHAVAGRPQPIHRPDETETRPRSGDKSRAEIRSVPRVAREVACQRRSRVPDERHGCQVSHALASTLHEDLTDNIDAWPDMQPMILVDKGRVRSEPQSLEMQYVGAMPMAVHGAPASCVPTPET
jgi:hypothetical protein